MAFLLISLFLLLIYSALLIYYRVGWVQLKTYYPAKGQKNLTFITVVIAARNEEKNIGNCIESIIKQTYPNELFELIIIDDHSNDATVSIVRSFMNTDSVQKKIIIKLYQLKDFREAETLNSYKKKAIETGISLSGGSLIVTTDADCIVHPSWLQTIATYYEKFKPVFIAAPVVYINPFKSDSPIMKFFKIFQSLDFITLQGITGASVHKKFHSMCNGANLAYEKKVFLEVDGFKDIDLIASGDDMLLMHKIHRLYPDRIQYLKSADAIVQTIPADTLEEFMNQRVRWASKADKYSNAKITAVLSLVYIFNGWIFFMAICSFFYNNIVYLFLLLIIMKTLVELFFLLPVTKFFKRQPLLWLFFPAQPFHIIYTLIAGWLGKFGSYEWKGRKVK